MCSRGSTEEGRSGEEAARQRAPPAVDVLGGNPQAAQNVAGESPRHAPQPVAAAPRPVPPVTNPSTVPLPESDASASLGMENAAPTSLPAALRIDSVSEKVPAEESVAQAVKVSRSLPTTSPKEDHGSSAEKQKFPAALRPSLTADPQIDSTVQRLQYGSQTDKEKSHSNCETNQIESPKEGVGLVAETEEKESVTLEYKPETGTNMELDGKEHTGRNTLPPPQSQILVTATSVPPSSVSFKARGVTEHGAVEQSGEVVTNRGSHIPPAGAAAQAGGRQDSQSTPLPSPSPDAGQIKQTDASETQEVVGAISNDNGEPQKENSVPASKPVKELVDTSAEILETPNTDQLHSGLYSSSEGDIHRGEQVETDTSTSSSHFAVLSLCSSAPEKSPAAASELDAGLVVSLQTEQVVETVTSHPPDQDLAEHPAEAQEIVVVREEAHISGDWPGVHLNQSYLLQRQDGTVCEAAIVDDREPKLYEESVQAEIELHSQPVEVYEFCGLVEEVAEETICAGSAQPPHSPGYEVNLFNALLENSDYMVKEDGEEGETVLISQQPSPLPHDTNQTQGCPTSNAHSLVLEAGQAVQVANSSEVCLVEVAAVTSDSFTVEQTDASLQIVTPHSQIDTLTQNQTEVSDSPTSPRKQEAEAAAGAVSFISPVVTGADAGTESSVAVSVSHVQNEPRLTPPVVTVVSTTDPAPTATPHNSAAPSQAKPEAACGPQISGVLNPKLLLLKPGEGPLLKHPPSISAQVSQRPNAGGELANAHSSWSGTVSDECLPRTDSQTHQSVSKTPVTAALATQSGVVSAQTGSLTPSSSTSTSDKEALTVTKTPTSGVGVTAPAATPNTLYVFSASAGKENTLLASSSPTEPILQTDSLYEEEEEEDEDEEDEEEEDMEQDEGEGQEAASGQVSSPEECSDEEADGDKTESDMATPSSELKVFTTWMGPRVDRKEGLGAQLERRLAQMSRQTPVSS